MSHVAAALSIGIAAAPRTKNARAARIGRSRPATRPAKARASGRAPSAIEVRA